MDEALLITGSLLFGAGAGALLTYVHDRSLLCLYGNLVHDLSRMLRHEKGSPEPPATAATIAEWRPSSGLTGKSVF